MKRHNNLTLLAVTTKALTAAGIRWGVASQTGQLLEQRRTWRNGPGAAWREAVAFESRVIWDFYTQAKKSDSDLTLNNFFKSKKHVEKILTKPTGVALRKLARSVLAAT